MSYRKCSVSAIYPECGGRHSTHQMRLLVTLLHAEPKDDELAATRGRSRCGAAIIWDLLVRSSGRGAWQTACPSVKHDSLVDRVTIWSQYAFPLIFKGMLTTCGVPPFKEPNRKPTPF